MPANEHHPAGRGADHARRVDDHLVEADRGRDAVAADEVDDVELARGWSIADTQPFAIARTKTIQSSSAPEATSTPVATATARPRSGSRSASCARPHGRETHPPTHSPAARARTRSRDRAEREPARMEDVDDEPRKADDLRRHAGAGDDLGDEPPAERRDLKRAERAARLRSGNRDCFGFEDDFLLGCSRAAGSQVRRLTHHVDVPGPAPTKPPVRACGSRRSCRRGSPGPS